jgi:NADPH-dependent 2,4-dienoyl-CoA reductase/sulfur reductase-like enzyme
VPFPGWTLPGVITGGAQNLMKGYRLLPGRRVLIAGSGPLLLVVAHYLLSGGANVAAICEAAPMRQLWRYAHPCCRT